MNLTDHEKAIAALPRLAVWRADDRETWLQVGMALHSVSDDSELLEAWDTWSRQSKKYTPRECDRQWRSFKRDKGTTIATLLKWAADDAGGMAIPPRPPAAPRNPRAPRSTANTEVPKRPYPTPEAAQAGSLWQVQQEAREKKLDPGKVCFAGSWTYPGDARVLRFDLGAIDEATGKMKKVFRPIHKNGVNWFVGDPPGLWPLYHRDELPADGPIHVCEGEKATDAARSVGLAATTSAHGCNAGDKTDWRPLAGREIIILPDNDDDGRKYAENVAATLTMLGCTVRVVNLFEADHGT
jgi:hypothetical protein